jgi:TRAP transporter TAXI family solute receptor
MLARLNLFFLVLLALVIAGVGGYLYYGTVREDHLIVAAGVRNDEGFRLLEAIAEVVNRHDARLHLEVIETAGSLDNGRLMDEGYADLVTLQADGSRSLSGRLIANLYPAAYHLIVRRDAGIEWIPDLAGKRIALPSKGSAEYTSFWFLAGHYGLDESSVTALPMSNRAADWALINGAVDASFLIRAPGDASIKTLIEQSELELVPIGQAPGLHLQKIAIQPGMIPKGSYQGNPPLPARDLETASVQEWLVASADLPAGVVYRISKVLFERRRELADLSSLASMISAPVANAGTHLPLHEGALRYYDRDKPSVWSEQANLLRTLVSLLAIVGSMIFAFRNWLQSAQKSRADAYNNDLIALYESVKSGGKPRSEYREELAAILVRVVDDLDNDRISRVGFDEFSFTWQAVNQLLKGESADENDPSRKTAGASQ